MPLVQNKTPQSRVARWRGTRTAFTDVLHDLESCMTSLGHSPAALKVEVDDYEGKIESAAQLKDELTEAMWRKCSSITVWMHPDSDGPRLFVLAGKRYVSPIIVTYHDGTLQQRETLRATVERRLPEPASNPARHWPWIGLLVALVLDGTMLLIATRIHPIAHAHLALGLRIGLLAITQILLVGSVVFLTRIVLMFWLPAMEHLPDNGHSRWDAARRWVIFGASAWLAVVLFVLTLPEVNPY
jgi:hypothetical protein